jgi:hypothetical protein
MVWNLSYLQNDIVVTIISQLVVDKPQGKDKKANADDRGDIMEDIFLHILYIGFRPEIFKFCGDILLPLQILLLPDIIA